MGRHGTQSHIKELDQQSAVNIPAEFGTGSLNKTSSTFDLMHTLFSKAHFFNFISPREWPPDLNLLDSWKACAKPHISIESLKRNLMKPWDEMKKYPAYSARFISTTSVTKQLEAFSKTNLFILNFMPFIVFIE